MKKTLKIFFIIVGAIIAAAVIFIIVLQTQKSVTDNQLKHVLSQIDNYNSYKFASAEFAKLKKSESNDIYYYAADGKRYIFPTIETYRTWFSDISVNDIQTYNLIKLYETPLGGNVTCRPGTLIQTPTDYNVYLVVKNGHARAISDTNLLDQIYNYQWKKTIVNLPNYYFSNYKIDKPIYYLSDFPDIPKNITIDQDKGFSK
jgi:hypothetical protein